jgi:nucleotide-binding universal stress UspA family protein
MHAMAEVPEHMIFSGGEAWGVARRVPAQTNAVAARLRRKAALFGADDVDTAVVTGGAGDAIPETATRKEADLVVMGIAHRSWIDRVLFGSTLRRVLRRATVPVLAIPVMAGARRRPNDPVVEQITNAAWSEPAPDRVAA